MSSIVLSDPLVRVIGQLLVDLGLGTDYEANREWPVYLSNEPEKPDNVITVVRTDSILADGRLQINGEVQETYGALIRVRGSSYVGTEAKTINISAALDSQVNRNPVTVGSNSYLVHNASRGSVIDLGEMRDGSERRLFTINYLYSITEES